MKTIEASEKNLTNIHTKEHNKDSKTGRSPEIEGYINLSCAHVISKLQSEGVNLEDTMFIDIGCDYGRAIHYMQDFFNYCVGFEPNNDFNPFDTHIINENFSANVLLRRIIGSVKEYKDYLNKPYNINNYVFFLNHSFEHIENPIALLKEIEKSILFIKDKQVKSGESFIPARFFIFIAVPHLDSEWAYWEGHVTLWNETHLENTIVRTFSDRVIYSLGIETRCFRETNKEIWYMCEVI